MIRNGLELPCRQCGDEEGQHHVYEPVSLPASCVCDWREWGCDLADIPEPCKEFRPNDDAQVVCLQCEHEQECHA